MSTDGLGLVAAWFVFGQARIVSTPELAEQRIDGPDPSSALAFSRAAAAARRHAANYDAPGRRLLPWYRALNHAYCVLVAGACWWTVSHV